MSYNINGAEFIASTLHLRQYYYHFFGWGAALFLLVFYFIKGVVLDPEGPDKGQLIPHILLLKTPVLAVFPVYAELVDYCRGFMVADLPFLDATFAASDVMALGAIAAVRRSGRRVPQDVAIVGFDDIEVAASAGPPLTTVRQQTVLQGRAMVRLLLAHSHPDLHLEPTDALPPVDGLTHLLLPVELVVRESA